ncbi:hypothetical protein B0T26DRAFT_861322 [Lasiosphaeria miniovina]|uniref:Uncharacterized protein n=1 Tax=Lasiosphaeria miniovina TaxID=1954250 RepID=A0AA40A6K1_9PEZI|nr:uncharacterized protein B0T26DRAFT_861322 [Lasiosphaeria miniovina]KAK0710086.1 hypothetical protein B0T26DRAFT_861322 [Lasiosphaeria miniovina]
MATNSTIVTGWVPEPEGRGTFGILRSCIMTLVLCVYTALHLNIPAPNLTAFAACMRKGKWVLMGCFAPELVVFVAWCQRRQATRLLGQMREVPGDTYRLWTMTHSFYATMGGFVLNTAQEGQDPYIPGSPRLYLLPEGTAALAKMGLLPPVSKDYILDKSNADGLAKLIVVAQSGWFTLQLLTRWAMKLPVTPLELTTMAHAVCALATYFLWWEKPLDICDPTVVDGEWAAPVAALMWMFSRLSSKRFGSRLGGNSSRPLAECDDIYWIDDPRALLDTLQPHPLASYEDTSSQSVSADHVMLFDLSRGSAFYRKLLPDDSTSRQYPYPIRLDRVTLRRWELFRQCIRDFPELPSLLKRATVTSPMEHICPPLDPSGPVLHALRDHIRTVSGGPGMCGVEDIQYNYTTRILRNLGLELLIVLVVCALAYGAIHAAAWNDHFPSGHELVVWKTSCVYVATCGPVAATLWLVFFSDAVLDKETIKGEIGCSGNHWFWISWIQIGLFFLAFPAAVFYVLARIYLVVEAFVSLRSLPSGAYSSTEWTQYLPHL